MSDVLTKEQVELRYQAGDVDADLYLSHESLRTSLAAAERTIIELRDQCADANGRMVQAALDLSAAVECAEKAERRLGEYERDAEIRRSDEYRVFMERAERAESALHEAVDVIIALLDAETNADDTDEHGAPVKVRALLTDRNLLARAEAVAGRRQP